MDDIDIIKKKLIDVVGFEDLLERMFNMKVNINYPPFNVEKYEEYTCIVIAVSGFKYENLKISLIDNQLEVIGHKLDEPNNVTFIYKGIGNRAFKKSFLLEKGMEIKKAQLEDGLLKIFIYKPINISTAINIPIEHI